MILFIRGIHESTKISELWEFVSPALVNRLKLVNGKVLKAEVLILQDRRTKLVGFYGLVTVDSEKAGHLAIKKLNGTLFKGRRVVVREYVQRSWKNDRRDNHADKVDPPLKISGKRRGDRRRDMEVVENINHMFTARKNASRKLI